VERGAHASPPARRARLTFVRPDLRSLDDHPADLLIVSAFADERPFEGLAAAIDWRLASGLSRWRQRGLSSGAQGERILYPSYQRLTTPRLILLGLGPRAAFVPERAVDHAAEMAAAAVRLEARSILTTLFGLEQLATPLERTAARVVGALVGTPGLSEVTLAVSTQVEELTRGAIALYQDRHR